MSLNVVKNPDVNKLQIPLFHYLKQLYEITEIVGISTE